jgi:outer membrane murein-binding lipoprotein Lpp
MIFAALVFGATALAGCATGGGSPTARAQAMTGGSAYVVRSEFS